MKQLPAACLLLALALAPVVAPAAGAEDVQDGGLALFREAEAWADKCAGWLDTAHTLAIRMKRSERQAVMDIAGTPELRSRAEELTAQRLAEVARLSCEDPAATATRNNVRQLAFETRAELTSRAASFAETRGGLWLERTTELSRLRHLLDEAVWPYDVLMARAGAADAWQRMRTIHRAEARMLLELACAHREAHGTGNYGCPPSASPGNEAALADAILSSAEGYALGYEQIWRETLN
jgi:hypothetical protein